MHNNSNSIVNPRLPVHNWSKRKTLEQLLGDDYAPHGVPFLNKTTFPLSAHYGKTYQIQQVLEEFLNGRSDVHYAAQSPELRKFFNNLKHRNWAAAFSDLNFVYYALRLFVDGQLHLFDLYNIIDIYQLLSSFKLTIDKVEFRDFFTPAGTYTFETNFKKMGPSGKILDRSTHSDNFEEFLKTAQLTEKEFNLEYYQAGMEDLSTHNLYVYSKDFLPCTPFKEVPSNKICLLYSTWDKILRNPYNQSKDAGDLPYRVGPLTIKQIELACRDPRGYRRPASVSWPSCNFEQKVDIHGHQGTWFEITLHDILHRLLNNNNTTAQKQMVYRLMDWLRSLSAIDCASGQANKHEFTKKIWFLLDELLVAEKEKLANQLIQPYTQDCFLEPIEQDLLILYLLDPNNRETLSILSHVNLDADLTVQQEELMQSLCTDKSIWENFKRKEMQWLIENIQSPGASKLPNLLINLFNIRKYVVSQKYPPYHLLTLDSWQETEIEPENLKILRIGKAKNEEWRNAHPEYAPIYLGMRKFENVYALAALPNGYAPQKNVPLKWVSYQELEYIV